jgi:hypothetical protein
LLSQRFLAPEQFAVDLREFFQGVIDFIEVVNPLPGALLLCGSLEQELLDVSGGQALGEIKERAVLFSLMTTAGDQWPGRN